MPSATVPSSGVPSSGVALASAVPSWAAASSAAPSSAVSATASASPVSGSASGASSGAPAAVPSAAGGRSLSSGAGAVSLGSDTVTLPLCSLGVTTNRGYQAPGGHAAATITSGCDHRAPCPPAPRSPAVTIAPPRRAQSRPAGAGLAEDLQHDLAEQSVEAGHDPHHDHDEDQRDRGVRGQLVPGGPDHLAQLGHDLTDEHHRSGPPASLGRTPGLGRPLCRGLVGLSRHNLT